MSDEPGKPDQTTPNHPAPIGPEPVGVAAEARELIATLLGSELDSVASKRLATMLAADAALRAEYQRQMAMHAMLQWRHGKVWPRNMGNVDPMAIAMLLEEAEQEGRRRAAEEAKERVAKEAREAEQRRLIEDLQRRNIRRPEPIVIPRSAAYLGAAGLAASVLWLAATFFTSGEVDPVDTVRSQPESVVSQPIPIVPIAIATIGKSVDARLVMTAVGPTPDDAMEKETPVSTDPGVRLAAGRYILAGGVIGLEFDGGASTILEAPATIDLESTERVRLVSGRLVGAVPPVAIGFAVGTPTATIVDLGTEFGVAVTDADAADVSVFDGEVEMVAAMSAKQTNQANQKPDQEVARKRLRTGDSARAEIEGITDAAETSANLYWRVVPTQEQIEEKRDYEKWLNYSRSLSADADVIAYYTFNGQQPSDQLLLNRAGDGNSFHGEIRGAQWDAGRWPYKQALRFSGNDPAEGTGDHVRIDLPGRFDALTLAAWVNVDVLREGNNGLLMTETWDKPGQVHWQILEDGRLHVGLTGDSDDESGEVSDSLGVLNVGVWSHVAVVFDWQASRISFFIDGTNVGTKEVSFTEGLFLGRLNLGCWKPGDKFVGKDKWQTLHGRVDELLVLGRAMSEQEIQTQYEAGKPRDR